MNSTINNQTTFGMAFIKPTGESAKQLAHLADLPRNERAYKAWVNEANKLKHVDIEYSADPETNSGLTFFSFHIKNHDTGKGLACALPYVGRHKNSLDKALTGLKRFWNIVFHPEYTLHPTMTTALKKAQMLEKKAIAENKALDIINKS